MAHQSGKAGCECESVQRSALSSAGMPGHMLSPGHTLTPGHTLSPVLTLSPGHTLSLGHTLPQDTGPPATWKEAVALPLSPLQTPPPQALTWGSETLGVLATNP